MKTSWPRCIRNAALTGLAWAGVWAPIAVLAGLIVDPDGSMDEMWVLIGAYPGFLCGVVFAALLGIAEGRVRSEEASLPATATCGAVAGLLVGALPFTIGESTSQLPVWLLALVFIGSTTFLGVVSALGTALAHRSLWRTQPPASPA